nr:putative reverse transcriptase domain-containing protein [Tanacetum cinerariifolium]
KCHADEPLVVSLDGLHFDDKLHFVEEPVEIVDRKVKWLRSTRLTPLAPVPTVDKADELILQDTLQVSLAEHKSRQEQEARENVAPVEEHLASVEIEKMVEG